MNANTKHKLQFPQTCGKLKLNCGKTVVLIRVNTNVNVNLNEMKVNNIWIHFSRTLAQLIHVLFFCLSASSGTEGIKHVKNFVPILALYRGFLVPQMPPLWAICTLRVCSEYVVWLPYWESIAVEAVVLYKKEISYLLVIGGLGVEGKTTLTTVVFYIPLF